MVMIDKDFRKHCHDVTSRMPAPESKQRYQRCAWASTSKTTWQIRTRHDFGREELHNVEIIISNSVSCIPRPGNTIMTSKQAATVNRHKSSRALERCSYHVHNAESSPTLTATGSDVISIRDETPLMHVLQTVETFRCGLRSKVTSELRNSYLYIINRYNNWWLSSQGLDLPKAFNISPMFGPHHSLRYITRWNCYVSGDRNKCWISMHGASAWGRLARW